MDELRLRFEEVARAPPARIPSVQEGQSTGYQPEAEALTIQMHQAGFWYHRGLGVWLRRVG